MTLFAMTPEDQHAVKIAADAAHHILTLQSVTPLQIIGLGNALYALQRLPQITRGARVQFGVSYRTGADFYHQVRYIDFSLSESAFTIHTGGCVYERDAGTDSFARTEWLIETNGYRETTADLSTLEHTVEEYLRLDGTVTVDDESTICYE